jgi:hypothetical protein
MLGFKIRSLPNSKTLGRYLTAYLYLFGLLGVFNLIFITIISDGITPVFPLVFVLAIPLVLVSIYHQIEEEYKAVTGYDVGKLVMQIQLGRTQSLSEALDERPEYLKQKYKKKSLIFWAKHYNNQKAHSIIAKKMAAYSSPA